MVVLFLVFVIYSRIMRADGNKKRSYSEDSSTRTSLTADDEEILS